MNDLMQVNNHNSSMILKSNKSRHSAIFSSVNLKSPSKPKSKRKFSKAQKLSLNDKILKGIEIGLLNKLKEK